MLATSIVTPTARLGRHPEYALRVVLVRVFRVRALFYFALKPGVKLFERVGYVLEEYQAKGNMLVLGGIHAAAERVRHLPELGFVADVRTIGRTILPLRHCLIPSFPRFLRYHPAHCTATACPWSCRIRRHGPG